LYFLEPDGSLVGVDVAADATFRPGSPKAILPPSMTLVIRHSYTATADGQRFLMPVLDQSVPAVITAREWR
jgi:hypothetical protein